MMHGGVLGLIKWTNNSDTGATGRTCRPPLEQVEKAHA